MTSGDFPPELRPVLARFASGWPAWIDVGAGWYPIIIRLDQDLVEIAPHYVLHQCKAKFGALRYYAQPSMDASVRNAEFSEAIRAAEWQSTVTCEECGAEAQQYTIKMWSWTLCPQHAREKSSR